MRADGVTISHPQQVLVDHAAVMCDDLAKEIRRSGGVHMQMNPESRCEAILGMLKAIEVVYALKWEQPTKPSEK